MKYTVKPILTETECEERHQAFLRVVDRTIEKYKRNESQSQKPPVSSLKDIPTQ